MAERNSHNFERLQSYETGNNLSMSFVNQEMDDRGSILSEKVDLLNESMQSFKSKEILEPNVVRPSSPGLSDIRLSVNLKQEGNESVNNSLSQIELPPGDNSCIQIMQTDQECMTNPT